MKNLFAVNFAENTITASKTTLKKASVPNSPEYKALMKLMKQNPTFTIEEKKIKEVSRLARSTKQLCEIIEIIRSKHLRLVIVGSITVDCSNGEIDPMTNAFIQMSGVFAELELRIIRERVRSGMANAKAKGAKIGRPQATADDIPAVFLRHYPAYKKKQLNVSELARVCDLSRTTVYKYIDLLER